MTRKASLFQRDLLRATQLLWRVDKITTLINFALQGIQALLPVASLYVMKLMLDSITHGTRAFGEIIPLIVAYGVIQLLSSAVSQYAALVNGVYQQKLTDFLSSEVLLKAVDVDYAYYENPEYHDSLHMAQQQSVNRISQLFSNFNAIVTSTLSMMFLVAYFFTLHSPLALLFAVLSLPMAVIKFYSARRQQQLERQFAALEREASYLHQTLTATRSAKEVRVFGFGYFFIDKFRAIRRMLHRQRRQVDVRFTVYSLIGEGLEITVMAAVFGVLAKETYDKTLTIGAFVIYLQGLQRLQGTAKSFLGAWVQLLRQRLFLQHIFEFFDLEARVDPPNAARFPEPRTGLSVRNLSFTYPGTERETLHDVSVHCAPGQVIAIVGENGCGKSTLVKLIARLYDVQAGTIAIDDVPLHQIAIKSFRENAIFLFQDFEKYFFTVEENIAIGDETLSSESVEQSARLSGAHPFIEKLGNGYQTRMGRMFAGSEQLSGGQWQKLALSRMFYKDAHLVVLDEPTSAIDPSAELELFRNIKKRLGNKMIILVTHRLYNLKIADRIYLMKDGRVIEEGSLPEMIGINGVFREMYEAQTL